MNVRWKRYPWKRDKGEDAYYPPLYGHALVIPCEVMNPPSATGRTVYVWFDDADCAHLLKELRAHMIAQRSKPMSQ